MPWIVPLLVTTFLVFSNLAHANVGEAYGLGARSASLAGAAVTDLEDGYSVYNNPAALARNSEKRLFFSYGLLAMQPSFTSIQGVVVQNPYTSDAAAPVPGNVDTSYKASFGQMIGLSYHPSRDWGLGFAMYLPVGEISNVDSGEVFAPEYPLYRARTRRTQVFLGGGYRLSEAFKVGAGLQIGFTLNGGVTMFLVTQTGKPSSARLTASAKPKATPFFGILFEPDPSYSLAAVIRAPLTSPGELQGTVGTKIMNATPLTLDFAFNSLSALYYDPPAIEIGGVLRHSSKLSTRFQVDYQFWHLYKSPADNLGTPDIKSCGGYTCGFQFSPSINPSYPFRNILVPRIGEEYSLNDTVTLRAGYGFRPSILAQLSTEAGNYVDPDKHMFTLGAGVHFPTFLGFATPCDIDFNASYHRLITQNIVKTPGDETGAGTGDQKVGAPGYQAGGSVYGGGVALTLAF